MIHEVTGDILLSRADLTAHGVAPNDHFDSGLALALRERWPGMARDFRHFAKDGNARPGTLWVWAGPDLRGTKKIANLITQEGERHLGARPGKATLANVQRALKELAAHVRAHSVTSLALSRLATGVGGLEWAEVAPFVREHLGSLGIPVYLYTSYRPGVVAEEAAGS